MHILMSIQSLVLGGAERFFVNLASGLSERHKVICYVPLSRLGDSALTAALSAKVLVHDLPVFTPLTYRIFYKLTLMLRRRMPAFDPEQMLHSEQLRRLQRQHGFDMANTHLMPAARQVCTAFEHTPLLITKTDHGDTAYPDMRQDAVIFRRLDALICPASTNAEKVRQLPFNPRCDIRTISHGHGVSASASSLPSFAGVTFGMVARGVDAKGWHESVAALRLLRARTVQNLRLVLVGDGPALVRLREETQAEDWIIHAGYQSDAAAWIRGFDVGLLPSCLAEESVPLSVIEYLLCGKPVIATAIGGIPEMVGAAGLLVPLAANGRADVCALAAAMEQMMNEQHRARHAAATAQSGAAFDLARCVSAYEALFVEKLRYRA
jgi:glycosyltransferase involved in cell wall biosynthesis